MMASYTYLAGSMIFLCLWLVLFSLRKDLRKQMLVMSIIVSVLGVIFSALLWIHDWWRPETLSSSAVGIEDLILGFGVGGILSTIYFVVFNKRLAEHRKHKDLETFIIVLIAFVVGAFSTLVLKAASWIAWLIAMSIPTIIIYIIKPKLIKQSLWTAFLVTIIALPVYILMYIIEPSYIARWWLFQNLTGIVIFTAPLEDLLWFFSAGMFFGIIYTFWHGGKVENR